MAQINLLWDHLVWPQTDILKNGHVCAHCKQLWCVFGLHIGRTVPSTKPQQFWIGAPDSWMAFAYLAKFSGERISCSKRIRRWPCLSYRRFKIWLVIMLNCGSGPPNRGIVSLYRVGYANRFKNIHKPSMPLTQSLLYVRISSGMPKTSFNSYICPFKNRNSAWHSACIT